MRTVPPCPHFDVCGGCVAQHMDDILYREWKLGQVAEDLARAGVGPARWDEPVFLPRATRRRAGFKVLLAGGRVIVGFHVERSHRVVDVPGCLVVEPGLLRAVEESKPYLAQLLPAKGKGDLDIQVVDGQLDMVLGLPPDRDRHRNGGRGGAGRRNGANDFELYAAWADAVGAARISRRTERGAAETMIVRSPMLARFGDLTVDLPAGAFLQPSRAGEAALVATALSMLEGREAGRVADLFAGCGTFAGALLGRGGVHAMELDAAAVAALDRAKPGHRLTVERRDLFTAPLTAKDLRKFDAVILDPPRTGAAAQAAELASSDVPTLVYVSCNPQSFARDARTLCDGGYRLDRIRVVDQFLWSHHIELIALFIRP